MIDVAVAASSDQSACLLAADAQRRRALGDRAEPLDVVLGEEQVVRAGFDRHVDAARPRLGGHRHAAAGADVDDVQRRAGSRRRRAARAGWRRARRRRGRDARKSRTPLPVPSSGPGRAVSSSLSACTATGRPSRAASRIPSSSVTSSARGNSGRPESHMNALKPTTPRSAISAMSPTAPGTRPPHSPKSVIDAASSAARLRSNSARSMVHGVELSGMSKNSVPPPAASARLPVAAPSHSVRPGSLKCRCTSINAGQDEQAARVDLFARRAGSSGADRRRCGRPRSPMSARSRAVRR